MKKLDKLMTKQFIGPFLVTFSIAMFVLIMQALWQYLERIAGKGLSFFTVLELLSYKCVGLVPLALPLGLLISSVMVLGGMAEHYELSSIKSSGTSLLRIMRPLILFGFLSAGASFVVSDYVIPAANLQFGARMYDINQKKPTLNMEEGQFNTDFNQFAIRLGKKDQDGRHIGDVMIYDHTRATTGNLVQITAKTGEMYSADQGQSLVMQLQDGVQYSERRPTGKNRSSLPYIRTNFEKYTKIFDLSQFNLGQTNTSLFETNRSMLATYQLQIGADSITDEIAVRKQRMSNLAHNYLPILREDTIVYRQSQLEQEEEDEVEDEIIEQAYLDEGDGRNLIQGDSLVSDSSLVLSNGKMAGNPRILSTRAQRQLKQGTTLNQEKKKAKNLADARNHVTVVGSREWPGIYDLMGSIKKESQERVFNRSRSSVRSVLSQASTTKRVLPSIYENRVKYVYDKHMKYSMAIVCIIFIFIGAPMGAIVRKGGFGYPILVSIIFFVIFIILTIFCRKLAESFVVIPSVAGWLPCIILFPISLYITSRAMKDAKLVNLDGIGAVISKFFKRLYDKGAAAGA